MCIYKSCGSISQYLAPVEVTSSHELDRLWTGHINDVPVDLSFQHIQHMRNSGFNSLTVYYNIILLSKTTKIALGRVRVQHCQKSITYWVLSENIVRPSLFKFLTKDLEQDDIHPTLQFN